MSGWFQFGGIPPEVAAHLREVEDHRNMHMQENTHAIRRLLEKMSEEDLRTMETIFANCASPEQSTYWRGRVEGILETKFDVCPCGESHDPNDLLKDSPLPTEDVELPEPRDGLERAQQEMVEATAPGDWSKDDDEVFDKASYLDHCDEYRVKPQREPSDHKKIPVICTGCGQYYVSLEDRMLRKPGIDGCSGCQQKSAWG